MKVNTGPLTHPWMGGGASETLKTGEIAMTCENCFGIYHSDATGSARQRCNRRWTGAEAKLPLSLLSLPTPGPDPGFAKRGDRAECQNLEGGIG